MERICWVVRKVIDLVFVGCGKGVNKVSFWYLKVNEILILLKYENEWILCSLKW